MARCTDGFMWIALCVVTGACEPKATRTSAVSNTSAAPAKGTIDRRAVQQLVRAAMMDCYEKATIRGVDLPSTVVVDFFIPPSGRVATATTTSTEPTLASCIVGAIKAIEFPRPVGGGVQITYPLEIRNAGR